MTTEEPSQGPLTCELNRVFPCLDKRPAEAVALARFEDCDCDPDEEDTFRSLFAICKPCLTWVTGQDETTCGKCGTIYCPGSAMLAEILPTSFDADGDDAA